MGETEIKDFSTFYRDTTCKDQRISQNLLDKVVLGQFLQLISDNLAKHVAPIPLYDGAASCHGPYFCSLPFCHGHDKSAVRPISA
jgi:hypothetical protein